MSGRLPITVSTRAENRLRWRRNVAIKRAMNAGHARGGVLLNSGERFGVKPGLLARLFVPAVSRILDSIDTGLASGTIHGTLPDGTRRTLGGNAPGFECEVTLHDWRALLRLATGGSVGWYQAWEAGEWSSPCLLYTSPSPRD